MYKKYFKRLFDLTFSLILILFLFPVMIFFIFLVWFFIGFPIFKQKRPGLNNKIFTLYKFKLFLTLLKACLKKDKVK